ncbi:hypothetical protein ACWDUL_20920 [Nocardia niigatensis]
MAAAAGTVVWQWARRLGLPPRKVAEYAASTMVLPATSMLVDWDFAAPLKLLEQAQQAAMLGGGYIPVAIAATAITAVPLGSSTAALFFARTREREIDGTGASSVAAVINRNARHNRASANAARRRAAASPPPLTTRHKGLLPTHVVLGTCSRRVTFAPDTVSSMLRKPVRRLAEIPLSALEKHLVVFGATRQGKTTLMLRLALAVFEADWQRYLHRDSLSKKQRAKATRPLVVFLGCGGDVETLERFREAMMLKGIQPDRIIAWPGDEGSGLDMFGTLDKAVITEVLESIVAPEHAQGENQIFHEMFKRAVRLAMGAVDGCEIAPPKNHKELLERVSSPDELRILYRFYPEILAEIDNWEGCQPSITTHTASVLRNTWESLGDSLDGPRSFDEADGLYLLVPGASQKVTANRQALVLLQMLFSFASTRRRRIWLFIDEIDALTDEKRDIDVFGLLERASKENMSVILGTHTAEGTGSTVERVQRALKGARGGAVFMGGDGLDLACATFGTVERPKTTRHRRGDTSAASDQIPLVTPQQVSVLEVGDFIYATKGTATHGHSPDLDPRLLKPITRTAATTLPPARPVAPATPDPKAASLDTTRKPGRAA